MHNVMYCLNGHYIALVNPTVDPIMLPYALDDAEDEGAKRLPSFCAECGSATLAACLHCQSPIVFQHQTDTPSYCERCGKPLPWTETALTAAREYTDELDGLTSANKTALKATFVALTTDTARTPLAASRFKKILAEVAPEAAKGLMKIVVSVATDEVKKQLGLVR
jgi:hypothetical protein